MRKRNFAITAILFACAFAAVWVYGSSPGSVYPERRTGATSEGKMPSRLNKAKQASPAKSWEAAESVATLYGVVNNGGNITYSSFAAATPFAPTTIFTDPNLNPTGQAVYVDGKLYCNYWAQDAFGNRTTKQYVYDTTDGSLIDTRDILIMSCASVMTYDPTTDRVYGQFYDDESNMSERWWGIMDLDDADMYGLQTISSMDQLFALAASPDGVFYGIDKFGKLVTVDRETGAIASTIGETGIIPQYIQSATIDANTGKMYWAASTSTGAGNGIYEVDLTTGAATCIVPFTGNVQVMGLHNIAPKAKPAAPGEISGLELDFPDGSLTGNIRFTLPTETYDGNRLSGQLHVGIDIDLDSYETTGQPGEEITFPVTLKYADSYKVSVYSENSSGRSPRVNMWKWLGKDRPGLVKNLTMTRDGNNVSLSWEAPEGIHGGYVDPSQVTYNIFRNPEHTTLENDYASLTYTEVFEPTKTIDLNYGVIAHYDGKIGPVAYSNTEHIEVTAEPPVYYSFTPFPDDFEQFTVIDGDNDGKTWNFTEVYLLYDGDGQSTADDWLISPDIHLAPGRVYYLGYEFKPQNTILYPVTYDIQLGHGKTAEAMTQTVRPSTTVKTEDASTWTGGYPPVSFTDNIIIDTDGTYNIGLHLTSSFAKVRLSYISVSPGPLTTAPAAPTDLTVTAADEGELSAEISVTAPAKSIDGNDLSSLSKIEILRYVPATQKFRVIETVDNPEPGETVTVSNNVHYPGDYTYQAVAYTEDGEAGLYSGSASAYIGVDTPGSPKNLQFNLTSYCSGTLNWSAPDAGANGRYFDPEGVTYTVYGMYDYIYGTQEPIEEELEETSCDLEFDFDDGEEDEQYEETYLVIATNDAGESVPAISPMAVYGKNYVLPFYEQFDYGSTKYNFWFKDALDKEGMDNLGWTLSATDGFGNIPGCAQFFGDLNISQALCSGKIDISSVENPMLSFYVFGRPMGGTHLYVAVTGNINDPGTVVKTIDFNEDFKEYNGWKRFEIPLDAFTSQPYIHLIFKAAVDENYSCSFMVDDVKIQKPAENDLAAVGIAASADMVKVGDGTSSTITATLTNMGSRTVAGNEYTVDFYKDGNKLASVDGVDIKHNEEKTVSYVYTPAPGDKGLAQITAMIAFDADEDRSNNESAPVSIRVIQPTLPTVSDLNGKVTAEGMELYWTAPDLSKKTERVTDDFESYEPFAIDNVGEWTMRDLDGQETCSVGEYQYPYMGEPKAYQVFNPSKTQPALQYWSAYSGEQMLVCFSTPEPTNDDWLISPRLSGEAQNISFMAQTIDDTWGAEKIEIWYSTTGTDTGDFIKLTPSPVSVPTVWKEHVYSLPEGAKYFAIRCVSSVTFALFIDDISYERPFSNDLTILGYNVYRDGQRVNDTMLTDPKFTDTGYGADSKWYVTVVYDMGESGASNLIGTSGVATVTADDTGSPVYDLSGRRAAGTEKGRIYVRKGEKFVGK